ncbi:MAG: response regulator, partial [Chloroflexota bacterium]
MSMETGAQKRTILIVEDSEALLKLLSTQLEMEGYNTIMAADGQEGWDALQNDPLPDVVLLDVMMPRMSGFELCELIRSTPSTATLPVVILTALKDQKSRIKGIEAGANDFIGKPWSKEELYARIRTLIRLKDVQDRLKRQHERLQFLYDVSRDLAARAAMDQMLSAVLSNSISATGANGGSIVALGVDGPLAKVSNNGQDEPVAEVKPQLTPLEQRSVTLLFRDIKPQLLQSDSLAGAESDFLSVLAVPIVQDQQMIGFITLTSREVDQFNTGHIELIDAIARQAAISMDRTKLFAQVRSERRRFSVLISSMGDAVVAFDNQLRVTLLNPSAVEFLGSSEESLRGRSASEIITNDAFLDLLSRASENRADQYEEIAWDGKHLLTTVSPIGSEGLVSVFQDITFIKELQEAQLQLVEEKAKRVRATFD